MKRYMSTKTWKETRKRSPELALVKKGRFGLFCVARNRSIENLYTLRVTNIQFSQTLFNQTQRLWEKKNVEQVEKVWFVPQIFLIQK